MDSRISLTVDDATARVQRLAASLLELGLRSGDVVAVFSPNCVEYFEIMLAAMLTGVNYIPVNWHWSPFELAYVLGDAEPKLLFIDTVLGEAAVTGISAAGYQGTTIVLGAAVDQIADQISYERLLLGHSHGPSLGDPMEMGLPMFYTSGTTGKPKGVRASSAAASMNVSQFSHAYNLRIGTPSLGSTLLDGPIYHSGQWLYAFLPLLGGSRTYIQPQFDPEATLAAIERFAITNLHLVPTQFVRMLKLTPQTRSKYDLSSLKRVWHGAAPCPPGVKAEILDLFGDVVTEYYGSTELGVNTMIDGAQWRDKPGSIGRPVAGVEIRIFSDSGEEVPLGSIGTIAVRSPRSFYYHNEPAKTESAHIADGFVTVGDVGYFDRDGYLYLSDRKIDMIISGGVNIYPAEVEAVIHQHPDVLDVAVVGIPDDEYGESVLAQVSLCNPRGDHEVLQDEIVTLCRALLAHYKAPRRVEVVDEIPRSLAGKILKHEIRAPYWEGHTRRI